MKILLCDLCGFVFQNFVFNPDSAIGIFTELEDVKESNFRSEERLHSHFVLRRLRVRLSELRVENEMNSCQDWFNAEDGETDAEFAEHHVIVDIL